MRAIQPPLLLASSLLCLRFVILFNFLFSFKVIKTTTILDGCVRTNPQKVCVCDGSS